MRNLQREIKVLIFRINSWSLMRDDVVVLACSSNIEPIDYLSSLLCAVIRTSPTE